MKDYYDILGLKNSATPEEIRRAYRILARRYHPDVNPGQQSEDKFKLISEAYNTLFDSDKRKKYDLTLGQKKYTNFYDSTFKKAQAHTKSARDKYEEMIREAAFKSRNKTAANPKKVSSKKVTPISKAPSFVEHINNSIGKVTKKLNIYPLLKYRKAKTRITKVSIIEVSLSIDEAIAGVKKTIEITENDGPRKVSVTIPPGVYNGSVVRLRSKINPSEDLVLVIRVAKHPYLSISGRGLNVIIPITISEAINGASISVPTLDSQVIIRVPPSTQSGYEVRIQGKGVFLKDKSRGDIFYNFQVHVPESHLAVGIGDKAKEFDGYYERKVRAALPRTLSK